MGRKEALQEVAQSQGGFFTARQAVQAGYVQAHHAYHVGQRNWEKIDRGLFRLAGFANTPESGFVRWSFWAKGRSARRMVVVSHGSALYHHGLSQTCPAGVHVTIPPLQAMKPEQAGIVYHRAELSPEEWQRRTGFLVTTPYRTLLDMKPDLVLARVWGQTVRQARDINAITPAQAEALTGEIWVHTAAVTEKGQTMATAGSAAQRTVPATVPMTRPPELPRSASALRRPFPAGLLSGQSAFTLVELLVVIAIIAVLAAMLLPVLRNSVETSRSVVCINNQKQCGLAVGLYCGDYRNELIMITRTPDTNALLSWRVMLSREAMKLYRNSSYNAWGGDYLTNAATVCPSVEPFRPAPSNYAGGNGSGSNVGFHSCYGTFGSYGSHPGTRLDKDLTLFRDMVTPFDPTLNLILRPNKVRLPADWLVIVDSWSIARENQWYWMTTSDTTNVLHGRHGHRASVLWLDGHVNLNTPAELARKMPKLATSTGAFLDGKGSLLPYSMFP